MESNKQVQINWGTFNIPTLLSVLGILWYTATHSERQDNRVEVLENSFSNLSKIVDDQRTKTSALDNVIYRLTTVETVVAANRAELSARMDRQSDALGDIRNGMAKLNSNFEVLSTKIDNVLPPKKAELESLPEPYTGGSRKN